MTDLAPDDDFTLAPLDEVKMSPVDAAATLSESTFDGCGMGRQIAAIEQLGQETSPEAIAALSDAARNNPNILVRRTAFQALQSIDNQSAMEESLSTIEAINSKRDCCIESRSDGDLAVHVKSIQVNITRKNEAADQMAQVVGSVHYPQCRNACDLIVSDKNTTTAFLGAVKRHTPTHAFNQQLEFNVLEYPESITSLVAAAAIPTDTVTDSLITTARKYKNHEKSSARAMESLLEHDTDRSRAEVVSLTNSHPDHHRSYREQTAARTLAKGTKADVMAYIGELERGTTHMTENASLSGLGMLKENLDVVRDSEVFDRLANLLEPGRREGFSPIISNFSRPCIIEALLAASKDNSALESQVADLVAAELGHKDVHVRYNTAQKLNFSDIHSDNIKKALLECLDDKDTDDMVRDGVIQALCPYKDDLQVQAKLNELLQYTSKGSPGRVRNSAKQVLAYRLVA